MHRSAPRSPIRRRSRGIAIALAALAILALAPGCGPPGVKPRLTLHDPGIDDQDDVCIWVHPTERARSTLIASDKGTNRLFVYDLSGRTIQSVVTPGRPGNIDLRYGFPLAGRPTDIVAVNDRTRGRLVVYAIDLATRRLARADDDAIQILDNYGSCLARLPDGSFHALITSEEGTIRQFRLEDRGGRVSGTLVRTWDLGGRTEGCVCDDQTGFAYLAEEDRGIWKVGAAPAAATPGAFIATVGDSSGLGADIEGLTLYLAAGAGGFLIASSQGNSSFKVYRREPPHALVKSFRVAGVTHSDGIDVTSVALGPAFPAGLFAAHNDSPARKAIEVCGYEDLGLPVDTTGWDPRRPPGPAPAE